MTEYPRRAHELIVKIGADTLDDLVHEVENFARRLRRGEVTRGVTGGSTSGAIYSYHSSPEQTHDAYFKQLEEILARENAT